MDNYYWANKCKELPHFTISHHKYANRNTAELEIDLNGKNYKNMLAVDENFCFENLNTKICFTLKKISNDFYILKADYENPE
ncbi:MAG: hypothetical protein IT258_06990 [Saprospiraceae bacterium]|nr:hypothetical protein [Saprospiraceae bacterium]